jgi:hypothetical protein
MENLIAMDASTITNYDVLVEPPSLPGDEGGDYQLAKHKNHVGNNRLDVFLNLYQQGYDFAFKRGNFDECNSIVQKIVQTVCHQCVPPGRFLVCSKDLRNIDRVVWTHMPEDQAKNLLHKILQPTRTSFDDGLKRRRRSSLLRRSASESMVLAFEDDKKKVTRLETMGNGSSWGQAVGGGAGGAVISNYNHGNNQRSSTMSNIETSNGTSFGGVSIGNALCFNRMDVILTETRNALDPNSQSVGNNRLHILVAMHAEKYSSATPEGQMSIVSEVYQTVKTFWKGRFLAESNISSSLHGRRNHEELEQDEAMYALQCIFNARTGQKTTQQGRTLRHSLPTMTSSTEQFFSQTNNALHKQASLTMIMSPPSPNEHLPDMQDMRSAAVKSLQKQRQRQTIANRLEKISQRNLTGVVGPPPMQTAQPAAHHMHHQQQQQQQQMQFGSGHAGGGIGGNNVSFANILPIGVNTLSPNHLSRMPARMPGSSRSYPSILNQRRESTVLGKLDASVMEQLVADFEDADCDDEDDPEPLPPSNSNQFGNQWNTGFR